MNAICTFCEQAKVRQHCGKDHTSCTWLKCDACGVLYDWRTDRAVGRDGKRIEA